MVHSSLRAKQSPNPNLGIDFSRPVSKAQRLLALAGNGNHDRGPFDLVRLPTGQPPVGVKQHLELRAGIDLMPLAPVLRHRLQEEGFAERARAGLLDDPASAVAGGLAASKPERLLCRWRRLQVNPLQREYTDLGRRATWRGKSADLPICRQDPVAGNDQRHRIRRHSLADIARGFRSGAEFPREGAVGRCVAPSDPSSRGVDALEEWVLRAEVELEPGKICLLAVEIAPYSSDRLGHLRCGRAGLCAGRPAQQVSFGRFGASCRQLEARDARVVPGDPASAAPSFENKIMVCRATGRFQPIG